jgi:hypothetical protein
MVKPKSFRPWNPEQTLLLSPSPVVWLPENHLGFFLDLACEPRMMVVLLLYAYCVGLPSSRKIEKACWEGAAFKVLTDNQQPDHSLISDFRRRHLPALAGLFVQVLRLCQLAQGMSHECMLKSEWQLEAKMRALLRKAEIIGAPGSRAARQVQTGR